MINAKKQNWTHEAHRKMCAERIKRAVKAEADEIKRRQRQRTFENWITGVLAISCGLFFIYLLGQL